LKRILEAAGHEPVLEAEDGQVALDVLRGREIDVLVVDLHMPRLDGLSLLNELDAPPPAVIVLSAFEYMSRETLKSEAGAKIFRIMRKPAAPAAFLRAVNDAADSVRRTSPE
jgi:two-component system, NtrC family, response regulator AtoC